MAEQVILVDGEDRQIGLMDVDQAHRGEGVLHRAISVLLFDGTGKVLLQRRSVRKQLWPGIWSNTVCTHPRDGEKYTEAAARRLKEEMGIVMTVKHLKKLYRFRYKAKYLSGEEIPGISSGGRGEHEMDTVIVAKFNGEVEMNAEEVMDCRWMDWDELKEDIERNPDLYTPWFKLMVDSGKLDKVVA